MEETEKKSELKETVVTTDNRSWIKRHKKLLILIGILAIIGLAIGIAAIIDGVHGIEVLGNFITDQILGMQWLNTLLGMAFTGMFGAEFMATRWGGAIQFFIYDTIKIIVLLCLLIFLISYIQSYFPPERTKKILGKFHGIGANAVGALLGTVTPFCSCSSIPNFYGFYKGGHIKRCDFQFSYFKPTRRFGRIYTVGKCIRFPDCNIVCSCWTIACHCRRNYHRKNRRR